MSNYELTGTAIVVGETTQHGAKFRKRTIVIETGDKYPSPVPVQFVMDKVSLLDGIAPGDLVKVGFNLSGREYNGNYYLDLRGWRIEVVGQGTVANQLPQQSGPFAPPVRSHEPRTEAKHVSECLPDLGDDDVPF